MCSEVQSIAEHTIFSAIEINNLGIEIRCAREKRRVNTGFSSSRDENLNKKHPVITKKRTKPRFEIPQKAILAEGPERASRQKPRN